MVRRPLAAAWLSLIAGLALVRWTGFQPSGWWLPWPEWLLWPLSVAIVAAAVLVVRRVPRPRLVLPLLPFFLLGLLLGQNWRPDVDPAADSPPAAPGPAHLLSRAGELTVFDGRVDGPADARPWGVYLPVEVFAARRSHTRADDRAGPVGAVRGRLRLLIATRALPARIPLTGDIIRFAAQIRPVRDFANGQALSYRRYLADRGIQARATVSKAGRLMVLGPPRGGRAARLLERWRTSRREVISSALNGDGRAAGLLEAVLLGRRGGLSAEVRDSFAVTGAAHLLVVSGLHLAVIGLVAAALFGWFLTRSARLCARLNTVVISRAAGLVVMLGYTLTAGSSPATWRAFLLAAAALAASCLSRPRDALSGLIAAGVIITVIWPPAPFDLGFQMSFTAVAALIWLAWFLDGRTRSGPGAVWRTLVRYLAGLALATLTVNLALAPLLARFFGQLPLAGLAVNLAVTPLYSLVVVPLGLAGLVMDLVNSWLGHGLLMLAGQAAGLGAGWVASAAGWTGVSVRVPGLSPVEVGLAYALLTGLGLITAARRFRGPGRGRLITAGLVLAGLALTAGLSDIAVHRLASARPEMRITVLDVGPGSSTLVELPGGRRWLVDGGGMPGSGFDVGRNVVAPALAARKITRLEGVALSHAQADHQGGLPYLIKAFKPARWAFLGRVVDLPPALAATARGQTRGTAAVPAADLRSGLAVGRGSIRALWPPPGYAPSDLNRASLVLKVSLDGLHCLICGDIDSLAEAELVRLHDRGLIDLRSQVLIVPHHGSATSSSAPFLARVAPTTAVISNGWNNRFGFPAPEVVTRLTELGVRVYQTGRHGAVRVTAGRSGLAVTTILAEEGDE